MPEKSPISKLIDVIFGFALAIGSLSLTGTRPQSISEVLGGLLSFALSFAILIVIWWDHSDLMSKLPNDRPKVVILNIVLMFFVAVEPYLLNTLNSNTILFEYASVLYAIDMTFLMGISAVLTHILVTEYQTALSSFQIGAYKSNRNSQIAFACLFSASVLPPFFTWALAGVPIRIYIWLATLILSIAARPARAKRA